MKNLILVLNLILISFTTFSQQESKIKLDSSNKNSIKVIQNGKEYSKKSEILGIKVDSNKIEVQQSDNNQKSSPSQNSWIESTDSVFKTLISIATFIGLFWGGIKFLKSKKKK